MFERIEKGEELNTMIDWTTTNRYFESLKRNLEDSVIKSKQEAKVEVNDLKTRLETCLQNTNRLFRKYDEIKKQLVEVQTQLGKEKSCNEQQYHYIQFLKEQVKELTDFNNNYFYPRKEVKVTPKSAPASPPSECPFPNPLGDPVEAAPQRSGFEDK